MGVNDEGEREGCGVTLRSALGGEEQGSATVLPGASIVLPKRGRSSRSEHGPPPGERGPPGSSCGPPRSEHSLPGSGPPQSERGPPQSERGPPRSEHGPPWSGFGPPPGWAYSCLSQSRGTIKCLCSCFQKQFELSHWLFFKSGILGTVLSEEEKAALARVSICQH